MCRCLLRWIAGNPAVLFRLPCFCVLFSGEVAVGKSVLLAYSGGLDTSVLVGWLQDEGYDVHCLYVDLGQPCEDRPAILQKARDIGAKSSEQIGRAHV